MRYIPALDAHRPSRHDQQVEELAQVIADWMNASENVVPLKPEQHRPTEFDRDLARHIIREFGRRRLA